MTKTERFTVDEVIEAVDGNVEAPRATAEVKPEGKPKPVSEESPVSKPRPVPASAKHGTDSLEAPSKADLLAMELEEFRAWKRENPERAVALGVGQVSRATGGRKRTVLTPERLGRICDRLRQGVFCKQACVQEGVLPDTLYQLIHDNEDVRVQIDAARAETINRWVVEIVTDPTGKRWSAFAWLLERYDPETFHLIQKKVLETTGSALPTVVINLSREDRRALLKGDRPVPIEMLPAPTDKDSR